eukprot:15470957-Alexandrium_andersonii.AAC.1
MRARDPGGLSACRAGPVVACHAGPAGGHAHSFTGLLACSRRSGLFALPCGSGAVSSHHVHPSAGLLAAPALSRAFGPANSASDRPPGPSLGQAAASLTYSPAWQACSRPGRLFSQSAHALGA